MGLDTPVTTSFLSRAARSTTISGSADASPLDPAGHPLVAALAAEGIVAAHERDARQVDVDVDGALAGSAPDDVDQPGVERVAGLGGELLGPRLDRLGDPQRDPG